MKRINKYLFLDVDGAWEKAYDTVDLGDLEVRDCEYSDDEITLLEE